MKLITQEEEQAHYREFVTGSLIGGAPGLAPNPMNDYRDISQRAVQTMRQNETAYQRFMSWGRETQFLKLVVLIVSASFKMNDAKNGSGRWETVKHLIKKKIHKEEYQDQDLWKEAERWLCSHRAENPPARG
ncbi:hypothetical protein EDB81DRAFT_839099 [Dactylonectria macrodidyma]|uniref:Uncharacterized protein n=1 Tax=Dactylonectria macrodidyma TaxID=307937 RepID=A0A9P9FP73_9HYPO|nr:hypothetical protein EDB81DRAFT_839099 [Dactylonectria macrodidyma]